MAPAIAGGRVVVAHLGNGASLCALQAGRSIATTMGFTALDGLPMGTRCGAARPGGGPAPAEQEGMDAAEVEDLLYRQSGMQGLSGISNDFRDLLASDEPRARFAIEDFVHQRRAQHRLARGGARRARRLRLHRRRRRERGADPRACLPTPAPGSASSSTPAANAARARRISTPGSRVGVHVIPTDENLMIARHTRAHCVR